MTNIDYNQPLDTLLRGKYAFHSDKVKQLLEEVEHHQSEMKKIKTLLGDAKPISRQLPLGEAQTYRAQPVVIAPKDDAPIVSQGVVKPLVIEFLRANPGKHVTTEIFDYIQSRVDTTKEPRRSWVTAISLALNTLSKGKDAPVLKTPTANGNIREYEWVAA